MDTDLIQFAERARGMTFTVKSDEEFAERKATPKASKQSPGENI